MAPQLTVTRKAGGLGLALAITTVVFAAGAAQKAPCASRAYVEDRSGVTFQCYSDVADLLRTEQLLGDRMPYVDGCTPQAKPCDEYPLGSMYVMRITAWLAPETGDPYASFYWTNVAILFACALAITFCIHRLGGNTLLFAGAPMLAIYGTMNWDLIPVALSTLATVLWLRGRDSASGVLLGLGGVVKIYPLLLAVPFAIARWGTGHGGRRFGSSRGRLAPGSRSTFHSRSRARADG